MSLRARIASFFRKPVPPMEFDFPGQQVFGPGIGASHQPPHEVLLRESLGIADTATRAIANRISTLNPQVKVTRRTAQGTTEDEILDDHPLKVLIDRPHPNLSRSQLLRLTTQYIVTVGEAYWLKVGSGLDVPVELHPIPPDKVWPIVRDGTVDGWGVRTGDGGTKQLDVESVIRFYFPDPENPHRSEGYLGPHAIVQDSLKFSGQHLRSHYETNATPKMVLEAGEGATSFGTAETENFHQQWREKYNSRFGLKRGLPSMLPTGFKLVELALQTGADITPLLVHWRDDQLMAFGVPRSVLGQVVSGDRSSAETNQFVFDQHTILPIATLIAEALTLQLASDFDPNIFVDWEPFVSDDEEFKLRQQGEDLRLKVRSVNQVREDRALDPVSWGDDPVGTFTDTPYDPTVVDEPEPDEPAPFDGEPEPEDAPRARALVRAEWQRQVRREKAYVPPFFRGMREIFRIQEEAILSLLELQRVKVGDIYDPNNPQWGLLFDLIVQPVRLESFSEIAQDTMTSLDAGDFIFTEQQRQVMEQQGAALIKNVNSTTRDKIRNILAEAVTEGHSIDRIKREITRQMTGSIGKRRARTIARTEVLKSSQTAQVASFNQAGVERKQWNTSLDGNVRDTHITTEGQVVNTKEPFTLGDGERAQAPGIGAGGGPLSAGNSINCRCFVTPVFEA